MDILYLLGGVAGITLMIWFVRMVTGRAAGPVSDFVRGMKGRR